MCFIAHLDNLILIITDKEKKGVAHIKFMWIFEYINDG